jgi:phosphoribosylaminoimidazole-succinocarboxamide synthase
MVSQEQIRAMLPLALRETHLPLPGRLEGKVRDGYTLPGQRRLLVTTDRLSAFDRVLACVPYKGQVLNQLAAWWFGQVNDLVAHHLVAAPDPNASVVVSAEPFPVEVIVRGYITGVTSTALWRRYELGEREIYGYTLPEGLSKNELLPMPMITPTTKGGPTGHDERLTLSEVVSRGLLSKPVWEEVQTAALAVFRRGQALAERAGLILVDTKYEFGRGPDGRVLLIDEIHTPDSSRFWVKDTYAARVSAGQEPDNMDKEFVRLAYAAHDYRGDGEPPILPDDLWVTASQRYIEVYERLTSATFEPAPYPVEPRLAENLNGILV